MTVMTFDGHANKVMPTWHDLWWLCAGTKRSLDLFPALASLIEYWDCNFLLLSARFCNSSCPRCANPNFILEKVLPHHFWSMTAIATLRLAQLREINLKIFLEGCRSSSLFRSPDHNSSDSYLIVYSDQASKLSKAWAVTLLILPASLAVEAATG